MRALILFLFLSCIFVSPTWAQTNSDDMIRAAQLCDNQTITKFVQAGVNVNAYGVGRGIVGETALSQAAIFSCPYSTFETLINLGADANQIAEIGNAINYYVISGVPNNRQDMPKILDLLAAHGADFNIPQGHNVFFPGGTPLLIEAMYYRSAKVPVEITKLLLQHGANPNFDPEKNGGTTALVEAFLGNDLQMARDLIEFGADVNLRAHWGSPLMAAGMWNIFFRDGYDMAIASEAQSLYDLLLTKHPDLKWTDEFGVTELFNAAYLPVAFDDTSTPAKFDRLYALKKLLATGADITALDQDGNNVLNYVVYNSKAANDGPWDLIAEANAIAVAKVLIPLKVDRTLKNRWGVSSIDAAKKYNFQNLLAVLEAPWMFVAVRLRGSRSFLT